jgi:hypothetical protein
MLIVLVDWYFTQRFELILEFMKKDPKWDIVDYWFVAEWQQRGSIHYHGVVWPRNCPFKNEGWEWILEHGTEAQKMELSAYIEEYVTCWNEASRNSDELLEYLASLPVDGQERNVNSGLENVPRGPHPSREPFDPTMPTDDIDEEYLNLQNKCQRHSRCSTKNCLKIRRGVPKCKAGFPWSFRPQSGFEEDPPESGHYKFFGRRNDTLMNYHNRELLLMWRSNMDIKPVTSFYAMKMYLTKYMTKNEPRSTDLDRIREMLTKNVSIDDSALKAYHRLLMKSLDRDYGAQEVSHYLLQLPGYICSRKFRTGTIKGDVVINFPDDAEVGAAPELGKSIWQRYLERPNGTADQDISSCSFHEYLRLFNYSNSAYRRNKAEAVPRLFPRPKPSYSDPEVTDNFFHIAVLAFIPNRGGNDLLLTEEESWEECCYRHLEIVDTTYQVILQKYLDSNEPNVDVSAYEESDDDVDAIDIDNRVVEPWMLAQMGRNQFDAHNDDAEGIQIDAEEQRNILRAKPLAG